MSELARLCTGGDNGTPEQINIFKDARVAGAAAVASVVGRITSLWRFDGNPGAGAAPTNSAVCTNTTAGTLGQSAPGGSRKKRLVSFIASSLTTGTLVLYDRLVEHGNLSGTTTGAQTTGLATPALTRRTNGKGVQAFMEIYNQVGTTATTVTMSYTDDGGTSGNTAPTTAFGGTALREAGRMIPIPLLTGDKGVRAVASVTLAASTTTAGTFGVTLAYPLVTLPLQIAGLAESVLTVLQNGGPPDLDGTDAALAMYWIAGTTTAPQILTGSAANFFEK